MLRRTGIFIAAAVMALGLTWPGPAAADRLGTLMEKLDKLTATVESQQDMLQKQAAEIERLKGELGQQKQTTAQTQAKVEKVAAEAKKPGKGSKWDEIFGDRFSFSTDLRLRYEGLYDRQSGKTELADRHRYRIRWRLFGDYKVNDELSLHSMLTTSSGSWFEDGKNSRNWQPGRTSNQSMDDEFNNKNVFVGRIYATYEPKWAPGLELTAGKFKNTFLHTDIMWDPDVNPEGIYERYQYKGWKSFQPFVHFGQMVVSENNKTDDAFLFIWQAGADIMLPYGIKWTIAGSYYDWQNPNLSDLSEVEGSSAGNSLDANGKYLYDYKLWQGITFLNFKVANLPVKLWFDYIQNNDDSVPSDNDTAWSTGFELNKTKKKGDWALYFKYAEIEPDAVVGAVTDGDFYGANRKGYKTQFRYQLYDPWTVALSWFQTDTMVGQEESENRFQFDFIFKFRL
ncbi:hypothetical protein AAU61_16265 [Desulfocarbo indianensis]|nr:hypothetical protein AAU61_16265 [Desulfocarbo indianensis]